MSRDLSGHVLPQHVAFVMDGNGRWAKARGKRRVFGHEKGAESLRRITTRCRELGIREVTYYALSTENYQRRPAREVAYLMRLLRRFLIDERPELTEHRIRFQVVGDIAALPESVRREIATTCALTESFDGMVMRLALNYGARQEIVEAARRIARDAARGELSAEDIDALDEERFSSYLLDPGMSDPDLVVRTAGEFRLSNFLLWQSSYSEWWITEALWPDFGVPDLEAALDAFGRRERRYGGIEPAPAQSPSKPTEPGSRGVPSPTGRGLARGGPERS